MSEKMKLTGIELTTPDGVAVKLTVAQARDLYTQLHELFGSKMVSTPVIIERDRWPIPWRPYRPYWLDTHGVRTPLSSGPRITCKASSGLAVNYFGES